MDLGHVSVRTGGNIIEILAKVREVGSTQETVQGINCTPIRIRTCSCLSDEIDVGVEHRAGMLRSVKVRVDIGVKKLLEGQGSLILGSQYLGVPGDLIVEPFFGHTKLFWGAG